MDTVIIKAAVIDEPGHKKTKSKTRVFRTLNGVDEDKIQSYDNQAVDDRNKCEKMINTKPM